MMRCRDQRDGAGKQSHRDGRADSFASCDPESSFLDKIVDADSIVATVDECRRRSQRIVFTNGCFDILHSGHVTFLASARSLGDTSIVGVNSDASIRRLKGPSRPINPLEDRLRVLAALACVDYIVAFDEDTPDRLLRIIRPDVFVKGGDYRREGISEAALVEELGGTVQILPYLELRSTTNIIKKIHGGAKTNDRPATKPKP